MVRSSQKRALVSHRRRLAERGMSRYEVRGLAGDKHIVRDFARRLARGDATAADLRREIADRIAADAPSRGGVLAGLRRSPLVGLDLALPRELNPGRKFEL